MAQKSIRILYEEEKAKVLGGGDIKNRNWGL